MSEQGKPKAWQVAFLGVVFIGGALATLRKGCAGEETKKPAAKRRAPAEPKTESPTLPFATREEFVAATLAQFKAGGGVGHLFDDGVVEVRPDDRFDTLSVEIRYTIAPEKTLSRGSAETVLPVLAGAGVKALIERGWNPREKMTVVRARAWQPAGKSVTGGDMVRTFGTARYDYNEDRIIFER